MIWSPDFYSVPKTLSGYMSAARTANILTESLLDAKPQNKWDALMRATKWPQRLQNAPLSLMLRLSPHQPKNEILRYPIAIPRLYNTSIVLGKNSNLVLEESYEQQSSESSDSDTISEHLCFLTTKYLVSNSAQDQNNYQPQQWLNVGPVFSLGVEMEDPSQARASVRCHPRWICRA